MVYDVAKNFYDVAVNFYDVAGHWYLFKYDVSCAGLCFRWGYALPDLCTVLTVIFVNWLCAYLHCVHDKPDLGTALSFMHIHMCYHYIISNLYGQTIFEICMDISL